MGTIRALLPDTTPAPARRVDRAGCGPPRTPPRTCQRSRRCRTLMGRSVRTGMNIFFDVDHTIIDSDNRLRPGVRELFQRLHADGHALYLWSGIGERSEIVAANDLGEYVTACYEKPLYHYEAMLKPLGIECWPEFVVDDHPHLVHAFGGCVVRRYLMPDARDREMERVYQEVQRAVTRRGRSGR
jgi:hypothetical protein